MDISQLDAALGLTPDEIEAEEKSESSLAQPLRAEHEDEQQIAIGPPQAPPVLAAVPAADGRQYQSINALLKEIPPEIRVEVLEVANALGVQPGDELLYSILGGLGYHKYLVAGIPDRIQDAGEGAAQYFIEIAEGVAGELNKQGMECSSSILESGRAAKSEIIDAAKILSDQVLIAARKGVSQAATEIDLSKILEHIQIFSETQVQNQAKSKFRDWFGKGVFLAAVSSLFILACGFSLAWLVKPAPSDYQTLYHLFGQLNCKPEKSLYVCTDRQGGKVVFNY